MTFLSRIGCIYVDGGDFVLPVDVRRVALHLNRLPGLFYASPIATVQKSITGNPSLLDAWDDTIHAENAGCVFIAMGGFLCSLIQNIRIPNTAAGIRAEGCSKQHMIPFV